jgi:hypothetical protein
MPDNYCVECNKEFRSQSGLNGHNQWKHNKLTEKPSPYTVTGRSVEMFERVGKQLDAIRDEQENIKDMIQSLQRNGQGNEERIGVPPMATTPAPAPAPAPAPPKPQREQQGFHCQDCKTTIQFRQKDCPGCGERIDWSSNPSQYVQP